MSELIPAARQQLLYHNDYPLLSRSKGLSKSAIELESILIANLHVNPNGDSEVNLTMDTLKSYGVCGGKDARDDHQEEGIKSAIKELMGYVIELPKSAGGSKNFRMRQLLGPVDGDNNGNIKFKIDRHLAPYLVGLKKHFAIAEIPELISLGTSYAKRLYTLLKTYEHVGGGTMGVSELKSFFNVHDVASYKNFAEFNRCVLKPAIKAIDSDTDINVLTNYTKDGRNIIGVNFIVLTNPYHQPKLPYSVDSHLNEDLLKYCSIFKFNNYGTVISYVKKFGEKEVLDGLEMMAKDAEGLKLKNPPGYFVANAKKYIYNAQHLAKAKMRAVKKMEDIEKGEALLNARLRAEDGAWEEWSLLNQGELCARVMKFSDAYGISNEERVLKVIKNTWLEQYRKNNNQDDEG
jgi:hypothetical protein